MKNKQRILNEVEEMKKHLSDAWKDKENLSLLDLMKSTVIIENLVKENKGK